jgi:succinate dehydrogenase (ubiquinone) membrane anchor subunit
LLLCFSFNFVFIISGIEAVVVDYIRPSLFHGKTLIPNISQALVWVLSAATLGSLYYFNYTDVGIVNAIKMLWNL